MTILPDTFTELENFRDLLSDTEGHLRTITERVKEKDEPQVALRTLRRDLNCLFEIAWEISRSTDHLKQAHVMYATDEEEFRIKGE